MAEHAKGPWTAVNHPRCENWVTIRDASHRFVVKPDARSDASGETSDFGVWMTPENARLIAASPVMLEALESAERYLDECGPLLGEEDPESGVHEMLAIVRAAISRARGTP